eukprot:m.177413 g.177413  ORF g.177413 m.177413 type:complete len:821 (+) comp17964_c0_seq2:348-2810(+)
MSVGVVEEGDAVRLLVSSDDDDDDIIDLRAVARAGHVVGNANANGTASHANGGVAGSSGHCDDYATQQVKQGGRSDGNGQRQPRLRRRRLTSNTSQRSARSDGPQPPPHKLADFSTIDWVRETARETSRQRQLRSPSASANASPIDDTDRPSKARATALQLWDASQGWLVSTLIGLSCGLAAGFIDISADWLLDIKEGACVGAFWLNREHCCWAQDTETEAFGCSTWKTWSQLFGNFESSNAINAANFCMFLVFSVVFAALSAIFVKVLAPYAAGSGIPEVKTILSGFVIRGYFGFWSLIVKAIGMVLAVASGLSLGKEGPLVHLACCFGNVFCRFFGKYRNNAAKKREILSASSAAGVSVAFGAPVGGVLFSLEEVSYFFPHKTLWRSFFAALVAVTTLGLMDPFLSGRPVDFGVGYDRPWHWFEMMPFALLGVFGGAYGAAFCWLNIKLCRFRKQTEWFRRHQIVEVIVMALITALLNFPNPLTRSNTSSFIKELFQECEAERETKLCTESANALAAPLLLACLLYVVSTVFTFGIKVPAGLFIPSMAVGATVGRLVGIVMQVIVKRHPSMVESVCPDLELCITPGLYSMVGAAAALGGVTRMTVSLVVIMFELTGGLTYIPPLMLSVMISKWVGDALHADGIYDAHIKLNEYPFLDNKEELRHTEVIGDVLRTRNAPVTINVDGCTVGQLEELVDSNDFSGYPLVDAHQFIHGYVDRTELIQALEEADVQNKERLCVFDVPEDGEPVLDDDSPTFNLHPIVQETPFQFAEHTAAVTVIDVFRRMGIRVALVTSAGSGRLVHVVTKKDIIHFLGHTES